jgi:hypothetical protein
VSTLYSAELTLNGVQHAIHSSDRSDRHLWSNHCEPRRALRKAVIGLVSKPRRRLHARPSLQTKRGQDVREGSCDWLDAHKAWTSFGFIPCFSTTVCHLTHILLVAPTVVPFSSAPRTTYVHSDDAPLLIIVRCEEKLSFLTALHPRPFAPLSVLPSNCSTPSKASFFSPLFYRCGACTSSLVEELIEQYRNPGKHGSHYTATLPRRRPAAEVISASLPCAHQKPSIGSAW